MFDTFPFDEWSEDIAEFWTWGPANSTGTYILTALGVILMIMSLIGFVRQETQRLEAQAARLQGTWLSRAAVEQSAPPTTDSE